MHTEHCLHQIDSSTRRTEQITWLVELASVLQSASKIDVDTYSASSPAEAARAAIAASRSARAPSRASSCADASNRAMARASPRGANAAVSEGVSLQD